MNDTVVTYPSIISQLLREVITQRDLSGWPTHDYYYYGSHHHRVRINSAEWSAYPFLHHLLLFWLLKPHTQFDGSTFCTFMNTQSSDLDVVVCHRTNERRCWVSDEEGCLCLIYYDVLWRLDTLLRCLWLMMMGCTVEVPIYTTRTTCAFS